MANYDVDAGATTYHPSRVVPLQPERIRRHSGGSTRSIYWYYELWFESDGGEMLPAAFEEWEAFDDGATHSVVLPAPNDSDSYATKSDVYIEVDDWPDILSVNVGTFRVLVGPVEFTS